MAWHCARIAFCVLAVSMIAEPGLAAPALTMTPNSGGHPQVVRQISGTGFSANEAVDVYFDTTDQFLAVTDGSGAFANHELDIPKDALPGTHWITAVGRKTGDAVQKSFLVTTAWLQYGFDLHDRGRNPYENVIDESNVGTLDVAWSHATGGQVWSAPAYKTGTLYVGSLDHKLYALDSTTGAVKWTANTGGEILSSPAVATGNVYIGSSDGHVHAFNAATGTSVWSAITGGPVTASPVVAGNTVYFGSQDNSVYAVNSTNGHRIWSTPTGGPIYYSAPAVVNNVVYIGSTDDKLYALNASTGAVLWSYPTGGLIFESPAVANGVVYFGSLDGMVYAVDANTGSTVWTYTTGLGIAASPAVVNNTVFIGSDDETLYALNADTGTLRWMSAAGGEFALNSVSIANGIGYVGTLEDGHLRAFDLTNGNILWSAHASSSFDTRPIIADGTLYVGSWDHNIYAYALDAGNNAAYHRSRTPPSYASLHPDFRLKPMK
jgi:outer membrane protein assembly factor BamB